MSALNMGTQWALRLEKDFALGGKALILGDKLLTGKQLETATPGIHSDQQLIEWTLAGNQKAFEILLRRYQKLVYNVIYQMVQNHDAAADLTQDTFLKSYKALASFRNSAAFKPWLLKIASNTTLNYIRDTRGKLVASLEELLEENPNAEPPSKLSVEESVDLHMSQAKLAEAIARLPVRQRQIFILRYQHDLPYADIASIVDESESSIKSLLFRIREKLRKMLTEKELSHG